jgi:hypothetical protein
MEDGDRSNDGDVHDSAGVSRSAAAPPMPECGDGHLRDSPAVRWASPLLLAIVVVALAACDDGDGGDTEAFCAGVADSVEALRAIPATDQDVEDLIDLWHDLGDDAPLAIEEEWNRHADNLELAWTSDDQQEVLASAFAAEGSTVAIADWLRENCAIDFGPVTTIVPAALPTTTVAASTTSTTSTTAG